ncbi:MAG: hypothetical protein V4508_11105 [Pseudomonadota bacterium]
MKIALTITSASMLALAVFSAAATPVRSGPSSQAGARIAAAPIAGHASPGMAAGSAPTTARAPSHTGQPNQSCGSATAPTTPGNAATAPGSAFNPDGKAGTVYAGEQPQNSRNPVSVSQYDVACANQPLH